MLKLKSAWLIFLPKPPARIHDVTYNITYKQEFFHIAFLGGTQTMRLGGKNSLYSDELISATELNRQPGRILDIAALHPVTITRNDHAFALLRREEMAYYVKAAAMTKIAVEIINVAYQLSQGKDIASNHDDYGWMKTFDTDELNELVAEIINACSVGSDSNDWDLLDVVIHEWRESAMAINSPDLEKAFSDVEDEVPLTSPTTESFVR